MKPLEGIRVLDLSRVLAGPWCTQLLADLGADVIKIERPGVGDDTRHWGPPWHGEGDSKVAAYFLACNRGKRSAAIDLASPDGAAQVRAIADTSDVVVENFKVGALAKYGLDAASLRARNPRLVYASITGFGQDGPRAGQAGYDFMIQGQAGLMSITGLPDEVENGGPLRAGVAVVDLFTGMYTASAILAALVRRAASGEGATIDSALFDCGLALLANQASNYLVSGASPPRQGNTHPNLVPYQPFACADKALIIAVGNDRQFAALAALLGKPDWATDPRFATNAERIAHRSELVAAIEAITRTRPAADWYEACERAGIPAGPINSIAQALADPQATHRAMLREMENFRLLCGPVRLDGERMDSTRPPPRLGQHTAEILAELGAS
ncbi:CaiB/BaiF CoA transferase family protein [Sphingomonas astaxanthinifaciens]|uniref:CoA transferase n=1 Tax=Sphingomonas astaxanthinifaciens DSM 22298 TaxID=1123267 RepID=A0ABQ5Z8S6_9SPHN|nr:CaiB/BaiF CoA-transferase family protein [Sphingomonas astaxanthinifaciens]GLR48396.1 CoA transferase [Sphingomonas astaxanthinifaciens DSM 22298]